MADGRIYDQGCTLGMSRIAFLHIPGTGQVNILIGSLRQYHSLPSKCVHHDTAMSDKGSSKGHWAVIEVIGGSPEIVLCHRSRTTILVMFTL